MHCINFLGTLGKLDDSLFWCLNDATLEKSDVQLYNTVQECCMNLMSLKTIGVNRTIHLFFFGMHPILVCLLPWCFLSVLCSFCMNFLFQVSPGKVQVQFLMLNLIVWPN